jgi:alkylhydroperoxidase family enzyme
MSEPRQRPVRLAPLADIDEATEDVLAATLLGEDGRPINIFGVLAHHPRLLKRFNLMAGMLLNKGELPAREREIVILRVGWNCRSMYEFGQHTVIGARAGLATEEITALTGHRSDHVWSSVDADLIALADELCSDDCVSAATWERLRATWNDAELVELVIVAGFYRMVSGFLNTMGVQLDQGVPGWPPGADPGEGAYS